MTYNGIIEQKLKVIEEKIQTIRSWQVDSFDKLNKSSLLQNASERALQVAVEVMIDVSERILALRNVTPHHTAVENIEKLQELGILSKEAEYKNMVRFRNFIVHRYEKIDQSIIYGIIKNKLHFFEKFVMEIRKAG